MKLEPEKQPHKLFMVYENEKGSRGRGILCCSERATENDQLRLLQGSLIATGQTYNIASNLIVVGLLAKERERIDQTRIASKLIVVGSLARDREKIGNSMVVRVTARCYYSSSAQIADVSCAEP
eukprot:351823-Amphidinium_carterae.1